MNKDGNNYYYVVKKNGKTCKIVAVYVENYYFNKVILNLYGTEYLIENMIMRILLIRWLILGHGALYPN